MPVNTQRLVIDAPIRAARACAAALALLAAGEVVHAQPATVTPAAPQPGETRDIINPQGMTPSSGVVDDGAAPQAADVRDLGFVLRGVDVEGASGQSRIAIERAFAPLLGHEVRIEQLTAVAQRETVRYRSEGRFLCQVLIPAQDITDGRIKVRAVEGYVAQVRFRGDLPENRHLLEQYAREIKGAHPLSAEMLERQLLLMNDLGHASARGTLVPSQTPGAADLIVDFSRKRLDLTFAIHNRASDSLGPQRLSATLGWYGALTDWDYLGLELGSTPNDELHYASLGYGAPLGSSGARWDLGGTAVRANPGPAANLAESELQTDSLSAFLQISYPVLRSRVRNLMLHASLTSFDGQSEFDVAQLSNDRIRALRFGMKFDHTDPWRGINMIELEYAHGLDALGARMEGTEDMPLSRTNGRADFSKFNAYVARLQSLGGPWSALLAVSAQHTTTPLLSSELFAYGGEPFGRGHDPAELTGDRGAAAKLELRFAAAAPSLGLSGYTFYAFADWGRVRRLDPINELAQEEASSWGAGLRYARTSGHLQGFIEFAAPIRHDVAAEGNRDPRIFFGLQFNP